MLQNETKVIYYPSQILQNNYNLTENINKKNLFFKLNIFHVQENSIKRRCKNLQTY